MVITDEQILFLVILAGAVYGTWRYAFTKGYNEGYFTACAHVATGEITVTAVEEEE
jgi:hypothetical protein